MLTEKTKRDYALIIQAKNGDQRAFEDLMKLYSTSVLFEIRKYVYDEEVAKDLMMESMSKAFSQLDRYQPSFAFSTWVKRISVNHAIDYLRKRKLSTVSIDQVSNDEARTAQKELVSEDYSPLQLIEKDEFIQTVREFVNELKDMYKDVINLRYFEELSYAEIAAETSLPEGTVKARLHRAKLMLKALIGQSSLQLSY